jgi:hypothetical protein
MDEQTIRMNTQHQEALSNLREQIMLMSSYPEDDQSVSIPSLQQIPMLNNPRKL